MWNKFSQIFWKCGERRWSPLCPNWFKLLNNDQNQPLTVVTWLFLTMKCVIFQKKFTSAGLRSLSLFPSQTMLMENIFQIQRRTCSREKIQNLSLFLTSSPSQRVGLSDPHPHRLRFSERRVRIFGILIYGQVKNLINISARNEIWGLKNWSSDINAQSVEVKISRENCNHPAPESVYVCQGDRSIGSNGIMSVNGLYEKTLNYPAQRLYYRYNGPNYENSEFRARALWDDYLHDQWVISWVTKFPLFNFFRPDFGHFRFLNFNSDPSIAVSMETWRLTDGQTIGMKILRVILISYQIMVGRWQLKMMTPLTQMHLCTCQGRFRNSLI